MKLIASFITVILLSFSIFISSATAQEILPTQFDDVIYADSECRAEVPGICGKRYLVVYPAQCEEPDDDVYIDPSVFAGCTNPEDLVGADKNQDRGRPFFKGGAEFQHFVAAGGASNFALVGDVRFMNDTDTAGVRLTLGVGLLDISGSGVQDDLITEDFGPLFTALFRPSLTAGTEDFKGFFGYQYLIAATQRVSAVQSHSGVLGVEYTIPEFISIEVFGGYGFVDVARQLRTLDGGEEQLESHLGGVLSFGVNLAYPF